MFSCHWGYFPLSICTRIELSNYGYDIVSREGPSLSEYLVCADDTVMLDPNSLLKAGELDATTARLVQAVKAHPADLSSRIFLFELYCFGGEYEKANAQLQWIREECPDVDFGVQVYQNLLSAEQHRSRVFSYGGGPNFFDPPPPYLEMLLAVIKYVGETRYERARQLLEVSAMSWPVVKGTLNEISFSDIRDCLPFVAPVLEVIVGSRYYWVPWDTIQRVNLPSPKFLRDLYWLPGELSLRSGIHLSVFVPVLYPHTFSASEESVKLGRKTVWEELGGGIVVGKGQRLFEYDETECPFLEVRSLVFS